MGIAIAVLALGAIAFFLLPSTDATLQRVRRTSPDSLQAYTLKPDDRAALVEFFQMKQAGDASAFQRWVYQRRCRLQRLGLQLTEQSMLFRWRVQSSLAQTKLDTAFALGHMLATSAQDSFLWQQAERIKQFDAQTLEVRAQVSETFAAARDLFLQAKYADAARWLERTRTLARKAGDGKFLIEASYLLQYALRQQPEHERVIALGDEILQKARHSNYRLCLATALAEVADAYSGMNANDSALVVLQRAIAFAESIGDTIGLARCHFSRVQICADVGDYAEAEHSIKQVIAFDAPQRYRGQVLSLYGQIAERRCEYGRAEKLFREALEVYEMRKDDANHSQMLIELSVVKTLIGDYVNALAFGQQALHLSSTIGDQNRVTSALSQIGWIHLQRDSLPQAVAVLEKAITLLPADQAMSRANTWITLGMAYLKQHVPAKARSAFGEAEKIATRGNVKIIQVEARLGQGWVALAEGQTLQAQAYFVSSLDMGKRIHEESLAAEALYGISEAQKQTGNLEEALTTLNRALLIGETLRTSLHDDSSRVSYFSVRQDWFDTAMLSALQLGDTSGAFHYAERARTQAMRDALIARAFDRDTSSLAPAGWLTIPPTGDLQRRIPENVQVLEYRITADTLLLWLLENDKLFMRRIAITAAALEDTVQQFLQSVGATAYDDFRRRCKDNLAQVYFENQRLGKILFRILLKPIAHELVEEKHLYIVPDAGLHLLPWGALVDAEDKFFGASHAWAKAPSLTILASESTSHPHPPINAASQLLMVAGDWASTTTQKHSLRGMFKNFALLHEAHASFENVQQALAAGADIGYFSVRAVADMHQPWNSYLELADEQAESRWQPRKAYVRELSAWDFSKIHLLILNACETASGKIERGEGGMSMARFFTRAHVPHVVASLWQNDDHISAQIVNEFLRGLQQEQDMIYGLRQATRRCIEELQHDYHYPLPYFWAAFELHEVDFSNSTHPKFN